MRSLWLLAFLVGICVAEWDSLMENAGLHEGDMVLTAEQKAHMKKHGYAGTRGKTWPNNVIPYTVTREIRSSSRAMSAIRSAIAAFSSQTCIRFKERTTESVYLKIFKGGGCYSFVGYNGRSYDLSLASGCWRTGIVIHEFMHAAGFYHEQSRSDRDNYLTIVWSNIQSSMKSNFQKQNTHDYGSKYDYMSIMHYRENAFGNGRVTMRTKDPGMQKRIGTAQGFSSSDVYQLKKMYQCGGTGPNTPRPYTPRPNTPRPWTPRPNTPRPGGCQDSNGACYLWKSLCGSHNNIRQICKRTCNLC